MPPRRPNLLLLLLTAFALLLAMFAAGAMLTGLVADLAPVAEASPKDKERWDSKYSDDAYLFGKEPVAFLKEHLPLLPKGQVLELAMGEGRNGVFLAQQGFEVTGLDISEKGLEKARKLAEARGVRITTQVADLETYRLPPNTYDVIVCTYYLQRSLFPQIIAALKPGGMVVLETYTIDHLKYRPRFNPEYLLNTNELLDHFQDLKILRYEARDTGEAAFASLLAQKP